tara:strand:+ start:521 stop:2047 length:1527 start_codon:yes stop_codon:yes gene_type:complete
MAADQSLIQASLAEARSRKVIDKTPFYEAELDIISKTTTGIIDFISKKEKAKEKGFNSIAGEVEGMLRKLSGSSEQLGGMHEANVQKLKDLKQKYLSVYGDADKEKEIMFEIEQIATEINGLAAGFSKFGQAYIDGSIDIGSSNAGFYDVFKEIWHKDSDYGNLDFQWKNNKLEVSVGGKDFQSVTDLFDGIELKDDTPRIGLGEIGNNVSKFAYEPNNINKSFEDVKKSSIDVVNSLMSTPGKFSNLTKKSFEGEVSYYDALATMFDDDETNDNKEMVAILKSLGLDEGIKNKTVLFEALTDIHNKEIFDFDTAKKLATEFYLEGYVRSKFNDGRTALNNEIAARNNKENKGGTYTIGKQAVAKEDIDYIINLLNSNKDFPNHQAWNGVLYKKENGKYYLKDEIKKDGKTVYKQDGVTPKIDWVVKTKDQVASAIGALRPDLGYKGMQTSSLQLNSAEKKALNIPEEYRIFDNGEFKDVRKGGVNWTELSDQDYKKWISWNNKKIKQ